MVLFAGVRFVLAGFDEAGEQEFLEALEGNGGQDMRRYCASCTHVIVCDLQLDDPICVAAQKDGKELVTDLWVADCLQSGTLIDTKSVLYRPLKDLNGIPGSDNLVLCLTGYQGQGRTDVMRMVDMMGARFTKPLVANKVTHLICYKFEGEKYELARRLNLKLVNHRWLEDCLLAWTLLPEADYQRSGFDLEFGDVEARDSEEKSGTPESSLRMLPQNQSVPSRSVASSKDPVVSTPKQHPDSREKTPRSCASSRSKHLASPSSRIRMLQTCKKGKQLNFQSSPGLCIAQQKVSPEPSCGNKLSDRKGSPVEEKQGRLKIDQTTFLQEVETSEREQRYVRRMSGEANEESSVGINKADNSKSQVQQELLQIHDGIVSPDVLAHCQAGDNVKDATDESGDCKRGAVNNLPPTDGIPEKSDEIAAQNFEVAKKKTDSEVPDSTYERELTGRIDCVEVPGHAGLQHGMDRTGESKCQPPSFSNGFDQPLVEGGPDGGDLPGVCSLVMKETVMSKNQLDVDVLDANRNADGFDVMQKPRTNRSQEACLCTATGECSMDKLNEDLAGPYSARSGAEMTNKDEVLLGDHKYLGCNLVTSETNTQVIEETALSVLKSFGEPKLGQNGDSPDDVEILQESRQLNRIIASTNTLGGGKRKLSDTSPALGCAKQEQAVQVAGTDSGTRDTPRSDHQSGDQESKSKKLRPDPALTTPTGSTVEECAQGKHLLDMVRTPKSATKGTYSGLIRKLLGSENVQPASDFYDMEKEFCESSGQGKTMVSTALQEGHNEMVENINEGKSEGVKEKVCSVKKPPRQRRAAVPSTKKNKVGPELSSVTPSKRLRILTTETPVPKVPLGQTPETPMVVLEKKRNTKTVKRPVPERRDKADVTVDSLKPPKFPKLVGQEDDHCQGDTKLVAGFEVGRKEGQGDVEEVQQIGSDDSAGINEWTKIFAGNEGSDQLADGPAKQAVDVLEVQGRTVEDRLDNGKQIADRPDKHVSRKEGLISEILHCGEKSGLETETKLPYAENAAPHVVEDSTCQDAGCTPKLMAASEGGKKPIKEKVVKRKTTTKVGGRALQQTLAATEEVCENLKNKRMIKRQVMEVAEPLEHQEMHDEEANNALQCKDKHNEELVQDEDKQSEDVEGKKAATMKTDPPVPSTVEMGLGTWFGIAGRTQEKQKYKSIIKKLGGKLTKEGHQWDEKITHLVLPSPLRRTEKFFAGAAAGRWLLRADYLEASMEAKRFVEELNHEWHGSGTNEEGNIDLHAPRKWRKLREETGCGAFYKLRVIIYGECIAPTKDALARAVKAGGGKVFSTSPPYDQYLSELDFALLNRDIPPHDKWVRKFVDSGIACVAVDYLVDYVCKPSSSLEKHILFGTAKAVGVARKRLETNISAAAKAFTGERASLSGATMQRNMLGTGNTKHIDQGEEVGDGEDDVVCSVCRKGDNGNVLMLCGDGKGRGCDVAFHTYCCKPPLQEVPVEDWFCKKCAKPPQKPRRTKK